VRGSVRGRVDDVWHEWQWNQMCTARGITKVTAGHSNAVAVNGSRRQMNTKQVGCMASCPERKLATAHQEVAIGATQSAIKTRDSLLRHYT
jgi:hypothetical protein